MKAVVPPVFVLLTNRHNGLGNQCFADGHVELLAPKVFDKLIHEKAMPVVIGVFVRPGEVKATSDQALTRYNRSRLYAAAVWQLSRALREAYASAR